MSDKKEVFSDPATVDLLIKELIAVCDEKNARVIDVLDALLGASIIIAQKHQLHKIMILGHFNILWENNAPENEKPNPENGYETSI